MYNRFAAVMGLLMLFLLLSACSAVQSKFHHEEGPPKVISTEFLLSKKIDPHRTTTLKIKLTRGNAGLENADGTVFYISKAAGGERIKEITAKHEGKGIYSADTMFPEHGVYDIQVHAEADGMRVMPVKRVIVGDVSHEELQSVDGHKKEESGDGEHHH
ncbi:FixH family protein [Bacillus haynesii]|uniref:YtkA-like domain-containing protein n=1 Tax=Bacillus haynesii TaxID=1925021 RepID=A0ABX3I3R3_9BACI|nr:FixH family protein [Bacillus haynesii]MCI4126517.1 FixH family protein [Bacillus haynesii]OMI26617.1 hypothetical protein BTA31_13485 [Bacillus haynesii]